METQANFSPLSPQHLDPDVFRRVWARVMPDQKDSPIVVAPSNRTRPAPPSHHAPPVQEVNAPSLLNLLEQLRRGVLQAQALVRRTGGNRALHALLSSRQQAMRQLSASYFLAHGQRFRSESPVPALPADLSQALRGQFLWEQQWARDCLSAAERTEDPALAQLLRSLSEGTKPRLRTIRSLLEHM